MDYQKYLEELVKELVEDETWELPKEARFLLTDDLPWGMLFI